MKKKTSHSTMVEKAEDLVAQLLEALDSKHITILERCKRISIINAQQGIPFKDDPNYHADEILAKYETERSEIRLKLEADSQNILGGIDLSHIVKQINETEERQNIISRERNNKANERDDINITRDVKTFKLIRIILCLFLFAESTYLALVFSNIFYDNNILVWIGSFVISFGLLYVTTISTLYFRDKPFDEIPWINKIGAPLFLLAVITALGLVRYTSVSVIDGNTTVMKGYIDHPSIFIILTALPIIASCLCVWKFYLGDEDMKKDSESEKLDGEILELEFKIQTCKEDIKQLVLQRNDIAQARIKAQHAESIFIERIDAQVKESMALYKLHNLQHRTDRVYPLAFTLPLPKLDKIETTFTNTENYVS